MFDMDSTIAVHLTSKWNERNLVPPATCRIPYTSSDIDAGVLRNIRAVLDRMAEYLASPAAVSALNSELFILNKLIYKANNSYRRQSVFASLKQIRQCLRRFNEVNLPRCLQTLLDNWPSFDELHEGFKTVYTASQAMVDQLLVRILGTASLLHQVVIYTNICFKQIMDEIHQGMLIPPMLVFAAVTSRIWALCHSLKKHVIGWYAVLYGDRQKLKPGLVDWLDGDLPCDIEKWIGQEPGQQIFDRLATSTVDGLTSCSNDASGTVNEDVGQLIQRNPDDADPVVITQGKRHLSLDADLSEFINELGLSVERSGYEFMKGSEKITPVSVDVNDNIHTSAASPNGPEENIQPSTEHPKQELKNQWKRKIETCKDVQSLLTVFESMKDASKVDEKTSSEKCLRVLRKRAKQYESDGRKVHVVRAKKYLIRTFESGLFNDRLHKPLVISTSVQEDLGATDIDGDKDSGPTPVSLDTIDTKTVTLSDGMEDECVEMKTSVMKLEWRKKLKSCENSEDMKKIFRNMKRCLKPTARTSFKIGSRLSEQLSCYQSGGRKKDLMKAKSILRQQIESLPYHEQLHEPDHKNVCTKIQEETSSFDVCPGPLNPNDGRGPPGRNRLDKLLEKRLDGKIKVKKMMTGLQDSNMLRLLGWEYEFNEALIKKVVRTLKNLHVILRKQHKQEVDPKEIGMKKDIAQRTLLNGLCDIEPRCLKIKDEVMKPGTGPVLSDPTSKTKKMMQEQSDDGQNIANYSMMECDFLVALKCHANSGTQKKMEKEKKKPVTHKKGGSTNQNGQSKKRTKVKKSGTTKGKSKTKPKPKKGSQSKSRKRGQK